MENVITENDNDRPLVYMTSNFKKLSLKLMNGNLAKSLFNPLMNIFNAYFVFGEYNNVTFLNFTSWYNFRLIEKVIQII